MTHFSFITLTSIITRLVSSVITYIVNGEKDQRWLWFCCFFFLYLFIWLLYVFTRYFYNVFRKPMDAVSIFITGNYLCQPEWWWWCVLSPWGSGHNNNNLYQHSRINRVFLKSCLNSIHNQVLVWCFFSTSGFIPIR